MAALDSTIQASGGDYTTTQAWHSAVPATPVGKQRGLLAAQDFVITADQAFDGKAPSSGSEVILTTQADASYTDVSPFVGAFDSSKARLTTTDRYVLLLNILDNSTRCIGVQFKQTGTGNGSIVCAVNVGDLESWYENCLVDNANKSKCLKAISSRVKNCIAISRAVEGTGFNCSYNSEFYNCISVVPSSETTNTSGTGFIRQNGTPTLINCCSFGYNLDYTTSGWDSASKNNASDSTNGPGANPQDSLTFADQFTNDDTDFTLKSGSGLETTGDTDATNNPNDVIGTVRASGTDGDIGWHEFITAGGAITAVLPAVVGITPSLTGNGKLDAALATEYNVIASLIADGALAATPSIEFNVVADLKADGLLSGVLPSEFNTVADLKANGQLAVITPIEFTLVAVIVDATAAGAIEGVLPAEYNVTANLVTGGKLDAATSVEFNVVSDLKAGGLLSGVLPLEFNIAGNLAGQGKLDAILAMEYSVIANLVANGKLDAALAIEYNVAASLAGKGQLISAPPIEFGLAGDLSNATFGFIFSTLPVEFNVAGTLINSNIPTYPYEGRRHIASFIN